MSTGETIYSIRELLLQWMSGEEPDESSRSRLQQWADASPENLLLLEQLRDDHWLARELEKMETVDTARQWQDIARRLHDKRLPGKEPIGTPAPAERSISTEEIVTEEIVTKEGSTEELTPGILRWISRRNMGRVAAIVLFVLAGLGLGKWWADSHPTGAAQVDHLNTPAAIAATRATLTLVDGSVIVLDNNNTQILPRQEGNRVIREDGHRLIYTQDAASGVTSEERSGAAKEAYNILTVPHGMQFELVLADGTKIWLNDASSLRYPVVFAGRQRDLELKGEAYFEVAPLAGLPFRVRTPSLMTDVLGTHFNVRDYPNEHSPRTTLLEGKVIVRKGDKTAILDTAGQEAQAREGAPGLQVVPADLESRMAWKSGYFYFDSLDIRASLGEVARWYQKSLLFKDDAAMAQLGRGKAKRNLPLHQLLKYIERTDLHFQEGDSTIIVSR